VLLAVTAISVYEAAKRDATGGAGSRSRCGAHPHLEWKDARPPLHTAPMATAPNDPPEPCRRLKTDPLATGGFHGLSQHSW